MYKLSDGIVIEENGEIFDKRLGIRFNNQILTLFLSEVYAKKVNDLDNYIDNLTIDDINKFEVRKCIEFCSKLNLIQKERAIIKKNIWENKRLKMQFKFFVTLVSFIIPIIPIILICNNYQIIKYEMILVIQFYFIHLCSIYIHELAHSICLWNNCTGVNGYYCINYISCSLIFNKKDVSSNRKIMIAISGSMAAIAFLTILMKVVPLFAEVIYIELIIQLYSLLFGEDNNLIKESLKERKNKSSSNKLT